MRNLLFSSLLIAGFMACKQTTTQTNEETGKIVPDSIVLKNDTISATPEKKETEELKSEESKKPGGTVDNNTPKPNPKPDKQSELDSIKNSYPKKK
jgi:hypothetical protein